MSIATRHLSKRFNLYGRPLHRFKEWLTLGRRSYHTPFWALRDVNLEVPTGTAMGIVGPNGAGKSTLLKIITGTLFPTDGEVEVEGRVAALLELGTGFHAEFTGRLNIHLNGKMLGLSDEEIAERLPDIIRFSELGDFIDQPIRTYSSGMVLRLGFSIASCVDPDVLIIDEALSVGDAYFSQKCVRRIREFREEGKTILFVSHDPMAVMTLCDRAVFLEHGSVQQVGAPEEVLDFYNARIAQRSASGTTQILVRDPSDAGAMGTQRAGNFRALICQAQLRNAEGRLSEILTSGERASLALKILFLEDIASPTVGVLFRNRLGIEVFGVNTAGLGRDLGRFRAGEVVDVTFDFPLDLGPGDYSATVAVHLDESHLVTNFDWVDKACRFRVMPSTDFRFYGMARLCPKLRVSEPRPSDIDVPATLTAVFGQPPGRLDSGCECDPWFLDGWIVSEAKKGRDADRVRDRLRRLDGKGRFLFRPTSTRMAVETTARTASAVSHDEVVGDGRRTADRTGADAVGLRLAWLGGSVAGEPGESGLFTFPLPADLIGRLQVFSLTRTGSAAATPEKPGPPPSGPGILSISSSPERTP